MILEDPSSFQTFLIHHSAKIFIKLTKEITKMTICFKTALLYFSAIKSEIYQVYTVLGMYCSGILLINHFKCRMHLHGHDMNENKAGRMIPVYYNTMY